MQIAPKFQIEAAAGEDESRGILHGAYIDCRNPEQHVAVATNGRILAVVPIEDVQDSEPGKIIPSTAFKTARKLSGKHRNASIVINGKVTFADGSTAPIPEKLEGNFPDWRQVVPEERKSSYKITFNPSYLAAIVQAIGAEYSITLEVETVGKDAALQPIKVTSKGSPGAYAVLMPMRAV